jgi:hypothetical protein
MYGLCIEGDGSRPGCVQEKEGEFDPRPFPWWTSWPDVAEVSEAPPGFPRWRATLSLVAGCILLLAGAMTILVALVAIAFRPGERFAASMDLAGAVPVAACGVVLVRAWRGMEHRYALGIQVWADKAGLAGQSVRNQFEATSNGLVRPWPKRPIPYAHVTGAFVRRRERPPFFFLWSRWIADQIEFWRGIDASEVGLLVVKGRFSETRIRMLRSRVPHVGDIAAALQNRGVRVRGLRNRTGGEKEEK